MPVLDPEGAETAALAEIVDFTGLRVLEIGAGDGRLTWRYAGPTARVLAIDPEPDEVAAARAAMPAELADRVTFRVQEAEELAERRASFDLAFLAWSL